MARYCTYCGNKVNEFAVVCVRCGCAIPKFKTNDIRVNSSHFIDTITQRIKTNSIIWIVIAVMQLLFALCGNLILLVIGISNLYSAIRELGYIKEFSNNPVGIVTKMTPITRDILILIYNLIFGGIIGVVGSIYYLVAVRSYVLENKQIFLEIENQYITI